VCCGVSGWWAAAAAAEVEIILVVVVGSGCGLWVVLVLVVVVVGGWRLVVGGKWRERSDRGDVFDSLNLLPALERRLDGDLCRA
jgi:hypothetical protein